MEMPCPPVITLRVYYPFHISLFLNEKLNLPHINFDLSTPISWICKKEVKYLVWSLLLRWDQNKKKTINKKTASADYVKYFLWLNQLTATISNKKIDAKKHCVRYRGQKHTRKYKVKETVGCKQKSHKKADFLCKKESHLIIYLQCKYNDQWSNTLRYTHRPCFFAFN